MDDWRNVALDERYWGRASKGQLLVDANPKYAPHYNPTGNTSETRNRLESVVVSMANGPVQISDE